MKNFLKKNWILLLVLVYFISPDPIPLPFDDITLLFAELGRRWIAKRLHKKEETKKN